MLRATLGSTVRMVPGPAERLAEGAYVEARVRARLFGMPILRLDAEVVLAPVRAEQARAPAAASTPTAAEVDAREETRPDAGPVAAGTVRPGSALVRAVALVGESSETLRAVDQGRRRQR